MKILFESDYFEQEHFAEWEQACKDLGIEYKVASRASWYENDDVNTYFNWGERVYVFGSIQFMQFLESQGWDSEWQEGRPWTIANPVTWENYECTSYYPHLAKYMLNTPYTMVPFGDLDRMKEHLFEIYGNNNCVFIRPNDGVKSFTGTVLPRSVMEWKRSMDLMGFYDDVVTPSTLCVVSEPQNITNEYRFVVIDNEIVTGSLYKERKSGSSVEVRSENIDGDWSYSSDTNPYFMAASVARQRENGICLRDPWSPDDCYTIDICETKDGTCHLLEIGSLGCAGLYACDRKKIAQKLKEKEEK